MTPPRITAWVQADVGEARNTAVAAVRVKREVRKGLAVSPGLRGLGL